MTSTERQRFEGIYQEHAKSVLAYFLRRCDSEAARDATAEVFLVTWRRLSDVPEGDETLRWLYGTARKVLANQRRGEVRRIRLLDRIRSNGGPIETPPDIAVVRREEDRQVHEALSRLRDEDRELLMLALWEELPRDELAAFLGCSRHAAAQRVHRATRRLGRELTVVHHRSGDAAPIQGGAS